VTTGVTTVLLRVGFWVVLIVLCAIWWVGAIWLAYSLWEAIT
jgi:hypothetical protein